MNFGLAKEIYGGTPWCMDPISFQSLSSVLRNLQKGVNLDIPEQKYNAVSLLTVKSDSRIITREWQLETKEDFEGIGIINLDGPITKGGGMSSYGMLELSAQMERMALDNRIKGFVVLTDSGGGASNAVEIMADTISAINKEKPVYSLITKGGMAASAAYGIISASRKIYSEDKMNIVGSVGTMISFEGYKANSESPDGVKHITVYASKSTMKNKAFEEALNNDNYEPLVNELLDPINENFISKVLSNRPMLQGSKFDDGHTVYSKDAIGTFIDGIASFDEVVNMVLNDSKTFLNINNNTNKKMTKSELQQNHPELYNEVYQEGLTSEKERVATWEVYRDGDTKAVSEGIKSGKTISPSQTAELQLKMLALNGVQALQADSAPAIQTAPAAIQETQTDKHAEEVKEAFDFNIK